MRGVLALLVAVAVAALAATADAGTSDPDAGSVTIGLSRLVAVHGDEVVASGAVQPSFAGQEIVLQVSITEGWSEVARAVTDEQGAYSVTFTADRSGAIRALVPASGASSDPVDLLVSPHVSVSAKRGFAYVGAQLSASIRPAAYSGRVSITVEREGRVVGRASARAENGRLRATVPTPGIGRFTARLSFPAAPGLKARELMVPVFAGGRTISIGSSGRDVRALVQRLAELHFHVPRAGSLFTSELADSVIAFQKAFGLPRTGVVGPLAWKRLERAHPLRARYRGPALHIEVDKTRQILMVVRRGSVEAVLPVSTGATGNTPEGRHRIRWKAPATTTWLGSGILYRTMTFYGNSFAIHGWPDVPAYPASHGCVRIPVWAADWLYSRSPVGETVYVYR